MKTQIIDAQTHTDEGPPGWTAGPGDITRQDTGLCDPRLIIDIPGACDEHLQFAKSPTGWKTQDEWSAFLVNLTTNGMKYPVTVFKEIDGTVHVWEGNHRLRAALALGWNQVPVEIRYFGNSQRGGLVI